MRIILTKDMGELCMSHSLPSHEGACKNIHGHNYRVQVSVRGKKEDLISDGHSTGMLVDFSVLASIYRNSIHQRFDHSFVRSKESGSELFLCEAKTKQKISVIPYSSTTVENIALCFFDELEKGIQTHSRAISVELYSIRLYETSTSWVEVSR